MNRRTFIGLAASTILIPRPATAAPLEYEAGLVKRALAEGETVFLDFTAVWCSTCASQRRTLAALKRENPDYERHVLFVDVDWDTHRNARITRDLRIPRRSTLVVLKGDKELGRVVAGTSRDVIKRLMDKALDASRS